MKFRVFGFALPAGLLAFAFGAAASCSSSPPVYPLEDGGHGGEATTSSTATASSSSTTTASSSTGTGASCAGEPTCDTKADCPPLSTVCLEATCSSAGCCGTEKAPAGTTCADNGGKLCDGKGTCVACQAASDCPVTGTVCAMAACSAAGACAPTHAAAGTACTDSGGTLCDGMGTCRMAHCGDALLDDGETDTDCGGVDCGPCADSKKCKVNTDCVDKVCSQTTLTCEAASCSDGVQNGGETGADCGGPTCPKCVGQACSVGTDCQSLSCSGTVCLAATCSDGVRSPGETDVDCGGPTCAPCADNMACKLATDCVDKVCLNNTCAAPTCLDGTQNGGESDKDCGGASGCPRCIPGKSCSASGDCTTNSCSSGVCQCPTGMVVAPIQGNGGIYCIDATEVSNAQYQTFYDANPLITAQASMCSWNDSWNPSGNWPQLPVNAANPVTNVNWCQALAYCTYAGRRLCGSIKGGAVAPASFADPSLDQWYNACSGQSSHAYPYGATYSSVACNGAEIIDGGSPGVFAPTTLTSCIGGETGLLEMSGNVAEWEDGCNSAGGVQHQTDACPVRGGSFKDGASALRCDSGGTLLTQPRQYTADDIGFRCCL